MGKALSWDPCYHPPISHVTMFALMPFSLHVLGNSILLYQFTVYSLRAFEMPSLTQSSLTVSLSALPVSPWHLPFQFLWMASYCQHRQPSA